MSSGINLHSLTKEELDAAVTSLKGVGGAYHYIAAAVQHDNEKRLKMPNRAEILHTAIDLTVGDREKDYGTPLKNHERIAAIWSVILECDITPAQVALCMAGVKIARLVQTPNHLDSFIDGAAYFAIAGEITGED